MLGLFVGAEPFRDLFGGSAPGPLVVYSVSRSSLAVVQEVLITFPLIDTTADSLPAFPRFACGTPTSLFCKTILDIQRAWRLLSNRAPPFSPASGISPVSRPLLARARFLSSPSPSRQALTFSPPIRFAFPSVHPLPNVLLPPYPFTRRKPLHGKSGISFSRLWRVPPTPCSAQVKTRVYRTRVHGKNHGGGFRIRKQNSLNAAFHEGCSAKRKTGKTTPPFSPCPLIALNSIGTNRRAARVKDSLCNHA